MKTLELLPRGTYDVFIPAVHDGDTFTVNIQVKVPIRAVGIQAAELKTPKGKLVAEWLKARILGKWATLDLQGGYKYGAKGERMGGLSIDGVDIFQEMVEQNLAVPYDGKGPRPYGAKEQDTDHARGE